MNLTAIIGTAVGLAFVYVLLSLVCSTIQEWIAGLFRRRAANLRKGILALLQDPASVDKLYADPMLKSLMANGVESSLSYLPADRFVDGLLSQFASTALMPDADLEKALQNVPEKFREPLLVLARRAAGDRDRFLTLVQKWFDDTMDRVTGWYKRESQLIIIAIAVVVTMIVNVDTVKVAMKLYTDPILRENVVQLSDAWVANHKDQIVNAQPQDREQLRKQYGELLNTLDDTKLPIWWHAKTFGGWWTEFCAAFVHSLPGWIITMIALSLGAPFWFDVLMKLANLRTNGPKPAKQPDPSL